MLEVMIYSHYKEWSTWLVNIPLHIFTYAFSYCFWYSNVKTILCKIHECFSFADKERICNDEWIACQNFIPGPLILCFRIAVCNICILRKYEKNKSHWKKNKNINLSFQKVKLQNVKKEILKSNGSFRLMNGWPRITKKTLIVHLCHLYDE